MSPTFIGAGGPLRSLGLYTLFNSFFVEGNISNRALKGLLIGEFFTDVLLLHNSNRSQEKDDP